MLWVRRRLRRWTLLSVVVVLLLFASACNGADEPGDTADEGSGKLTTVRLAVNNPIVQPGLAFMWLGDYFGWYEEEGIDLEITTTQGGADSTQRLIAGQIDIGVPPPAQVLQTIANGQDPGLVSVYEFRRDTQYNFTVLPDSNVQSIDDLRGLQVGVSDLGDEGAVFTEATIREQGWDEQDIEIIAVGAAGEGYTALEQGNVDALALPEAQYAIIKSLGKELGYLDPPAFAENIFGNQIMVRRDYAEENPDLLRGFLRVWTKGQVFFIENPRAALEIHFELFPETVPSGLTVEEAIEQQVGTLDESIKTMQFDDNDECQMWGCNTAEEWEAYIDSLGLTVDDVGPLDNLFSNEYLDYANDFDEKKIRQMAQEFQLDS